MLWVDIIIILIILGFSISGFYRGLVKSIYRTITLISSILITIILCPFLARIINPLMHNRFQKIISARIIERFPEFSKEFISSEIVERFSLPEFMSIYIAKNLPEAKKLVAAKEMVNMIASELTDISVMVISAIILFIIVRVGMMFLKYVVKKIKFKEIPVKVDKIGGATSGLVEGITVVLMFFAIITLFYSLGIFSGLYQYINESTSVARFFYKNNLIMDWILS